MARKAKEMKPQKKFEHHCNLQWCKGCGICVALCPQKVLALDDLGKVKAVDPQNCNGCKLCEFICPDLAIEVTARDQE